MTPGKRYRLYFINMSAFSRYYVRIQGDIEMEVIKIDGVMLTPGQKSGGIELPSG